MTAREMMTSLGALVLGLAIAGAAPALAQTTAPGTATTPGTSAPASPAPPAKPTPQAAPATPGHMNMKMTHPHMAARHHRHRRRLARRSMPSSPNANAQDADVDRLNQESLQAAQQGKAYAPSGKM